jgi:hypothetical protein
MAGYPPPFGGAYPMYSQDSPPTVNQNYYNPQAPYAAYSYPPSNPTPQQDMSTPFQDAPVLDANQIAYFFNQVNNGTIPPITPDGNLPQNHSYPLIPPPPPPPMLNAFAAMLQQGAAHSSTTASPALYAPNNDAVAQHPRIEGITRSDKEDGEVSEEGEVSTPGSRGTGHSKRGRGSSDLLRQSRTSYQAAKGPGTSPQGTLFLSDSRSKLGYWMFGSEFRSIYLPRSGR